MKRTSLKSYKNEIFDVLVIGGGITGACVFWDSVLRGMKSILIEKNDYASGTSQATSKLIHGGLRYLKNLEFGLVRESLQERRNMARISPHAVYTIGFQIPVYNFKESMLTKIGLSLYNQLSYDRNYLPNLDNVIPKHLFFDREETIHQIPEIPRENLKGSYLYYDYANYNPERHTTEFIFSARSKGGICRNYAEIISIQKTNQETYLVEVKDKILKETITLETKTIVNSSGPWADKIESYILKNPETKLIRSKGIHIITRKICKDKIIVLKKRNGTHLFLIPWRNKTIIGTTDSVYEDSPDKFRVTKEDILDLIEEVNSAYGFVKLQLSDVDFYYGGLRPLVEDENSSKNSYNASRKLEVKDYKEEGLPGFYSALGGKYTTSRLLAENLVDKISDYLPQNFKSCLTEKEVLIGGNYSDKETLEKELQKKFPQECGEKIEILAQRYGSVAFSVLNQNSNSKEVYSLNNGELFYSEELDYITSHEEIYNADDFFFRRSGVGVPGKPENQSFNSLLNRLKSNLNWSQKEFKTQKKNIEERYRIL
jgi:glycerol-3-phosphate dehydrogenase